MQERGWPWCALGKRAFELEREMKDGYSNRRCSIHQWFRLRDASIFSANRHTFRVTQSLGGDISDEGGVVGSESVQVS